LICNYRSQESRKLVYCNQKGKLQIQDLRNNKSSLKYDIGVQKGLVSSLDYSKDERCLYLGTLGGYILKYDFRLNSIIDTFKYNENTPIIGIKSYLPCKGKEYDLYSMNINPNFNKYLLIWTAANDHEMGLWNEDTLNCDMIFKVNPLQGTEIKPLPMEIPCLYKEDLNIKDPSSNIEMLYRNLIKNSTGKNLIINNISSCQYSQTNNRIPKLSNIFDNSNTVQVAISPLNLRLGENVNNNWMSNPTNENSHFILSAGNDMTIRYWDISKEGLYGQNGNPNNKRSFLVNAPNKIDNCLFNTSTYDSTVILQSNEFSNTNQLKKDIPGFSEYQNYNGTNYHGMGQCEFVDVKNTLLKFCTKMTEPSHRNIISDLMPMNLCGTLNNLLFSSSWDGTIKMWK
jgi:WD40 repeat protein